MPSLTNGGRKTNGWGAQKPGQNPGEPVYTPTELAAKLGITVNQFSALVGHYPLAPWVSQGDRAGGMFVNKPMSRASRYRLSDAKRWWKQLPETIKERHASNTRPGRPPD